MRIHGWTWRGLAGLAALVLLPGCGVDVDEIYDQLESENVIVRRLDQHDESALILQKDGPHRRLLVFVHGWNGNSFATWGGIIPALARAHDLPEDLRWLAEFDVLTFGYETGLREDQSIDAVARRLKSVVDLEVLGRGYSSVYVLAHSMGGLVVQRYLLNELEKGDDGQLRKLQSALRAVLYFDTPHNGLDIADRGALKWLVRMEKETEDMRQGSEFRRRLQRSWDTVLDDPRVGPAASQLLVERAWIFEAQYTHEKIRVAGAQGIYERFQQAGVGGRATIVAVPGTDHSSVCKSDWAEMNSSQGIFMKHVKPILGRSEVVRDAAHRPFGVSTSLDGRWVYVVASHWNRGGYVRRIDTATRQLDDWEASVGPNPHEFVEVDLGEEGGVIGVSTDNDRLNDYTVCPAQEVLLDEECEAGLTFVNLEAAEPFARLALGGEPDSIAVRGRWLAVSDGGPGGRIWLIDAATRELRELDGIGEGGWHLTGITFVDDRRILVAGHRGLGPSEGLLALVGIDPEGELQVLDTVSTLPVASDVDYLENLGLAAVSSFRESAGIGFHRLEGDRLTLHRLEKVPEPVCFRGARIADLRPTHDGSGLIAASQDGSVRRLTWQPETGVFQAEEFFHGGNTSWAAALVGDQVYVGNGEDNTVSVIWSNGHLWPAPADCS